MIRRARRLPVATSLLLVALPLFAALARCDGPAFTPESGEILRGRLERVDDGDSFTLRRTQTTSAAERTVRVRIHGIDAPERTQPFSNVSRQALRELLADQELTIEIIERDAYDRLVARVRVGNRDVARVQVRDGYAWVYRRYADDPELDRLEAAARRESRGLWREADPEAPWEFRARMRR